MSSCFSIFQAVAVWCFLCIDSPSPDTSEPGSCMCTSRTNSETHYLFAGNTPCIFIGSFKILEVQEECCYFCKDRRILEDHEIRATSVTEVGTLFL